jgi:hypothetical protein
METKVDKIKAFNSIIEDFLKQTTPIVGTTYYFYFTKLIKVNSTLPINYASSHLLKYKDKILSKDISYFSDKNNVSEEISELESKYNNNDIMFEILRLKDIYYKLNETSRDNVWDILQALLLLTIEYNELK